ALLAHVDRRRLPLNRAPELAPRVALVFADEGDHSVYGKVRPGHAASRQQGEQPRQVWEMAGRDDVARFSAEPIAKPLRGIVGLQIARSGELRERVAGAPHGFGGLLRAQLAAVPDDLRLH